VSLIGGQVDYHEGWVVSMAIDRDVVVTARPRADGRVTARSHDLDGLVEVAADASSDPRAVIPAWGRLRGSGGCCIHLRLGRPTWRCPGQLRGRGLTGAGMIVPAGYAGPSEHLPERLPELAYDPGRARRRVIASDIKVQQAVDIDVPQLVKRSVYRAHYAPGGGCRRGGRTFRPSAALAAVPRVQPCSIYY